MDFKQPVTLLNVCNDIYSVWIKMERYIYFIYFPTIYTTFKFKIDIKLTD